MANGTDINPWQIGQSQIAGAPKGGQDLEDMIKYLFETLKKRGEFDTGEGVAGKYTGEISGQLMYPTAGDPYGWGATNPLEHMIKSLTEGPQGAFTGGSEDERFGSVEGYRKLGGLLEYLNLGQLSSGYSQDMGDISSEIQSQMGGLRKGYGGLSKGSRYSGLGKRNTGKYSRKQYSSDIYDLQETQQGMQADTGEELEEDFLSKLGNWMAQNPTIS